MTQTGDQAIISLARVGTPGTKRSPAKEMIIPIISRLSRGALYGTP